MINNEFEADDRPAGAGVEPPDSVKAKNLSGLFSNRRTRNIILASAGVIVILLTMVLLSISGGGKPEPLPTDITEVNAGAAPAGAGSMTPSDLAQGTEKYSGLEKRVEAARSDEAARAGNTYNPQVTGSYMLNDTPSPPQTGTGEQGGQTQANGAVTSQMEAPQISPEEAARRQAIAQSQLAKGSERARHYIGLWEKKNGPKMFNFSVAATQPQQVNAGATSSSQATVAAAIPANAASQPVLLTSAGYRGIAVVELPMNSREPTGAAVATLVSGPWKEASLTGKFAKNANDTLTATFTQMHIPSLGITVPIEAISFNLDSTSVQGIATDVDQHLFLKYVGRPFALALDAVGKVIARPQTVVNLTTTTQTNPPLTNRDLAGVAVGSAAGQFAADMSGAATESTVAVASKTVIGVVFTRDAVYQKPAKAGPN